jgi:uncharacterized membrane protein
VCRIAIEPTFGLIALTVFDLFVTWLVWREYRLHRRARQNAEASAAGT